MRADRPGSYSIPATTAGMPIFSRRKSTLRSIRLAPPPRCRTVIRPYTLRPLPRFFGLSRLFSGVFFVISSLVSCVMYRRAGEVGLSVRIPMVLGSLDQLDLVSGPERHHRLLPARSAPFVLAHALPLALARGRPHVGDLDVEDFLHRLTDLDLVGIDGHLEGDGVQRFLLLHALLRHEGPEEDHARIADHASASCSDKSAAFSNTTRSWRITW